MVDYDNHFKNGQPQSSNGPKIISPQMFRIISNSARECKQFAFS